MRILLNNDDGYLAPGLACLAQALRTVADVDGRARRGRQRQQFTDLDRAVARQTRAITVLLRRWYTDRCISWRTGLLKPEPDMVIAGINRGGNLGDDVIYSGTVAAAMEGRFLGLPAIAVSLVGHTGRHFETAAQIVLRLIDKLRNDPLPADTILNVNVPDVPLGQIAGIEATRLGQRHKAESVIKASDPHGLPIYWVGAPGAEADAGPGTDFHAVRRNFVSITPLHVS